MPALVLDGKTIAARILEDVSRRIQRLWAEKEITPGLAAILVGDNPASQMYIRIKRNRSSEVGIISTVHELPAAISQQELEEVIRSLNDNPAVHGILVQLPLPGHLNEDKTLQAIEISKDVDGFHPANIGRLAMKGRTPRFIPATPYGCMMLLKECEALLSGFTVDGANAIVLGRSNIVGMPMALLLIQANATVTVVHSHTRDIPQYLRGADIVISAMGQPEMIKGEWIKEGAICIDVATIRVPDATAKNGYTWKGDLEFETARERAAAITPVPGGVGPMTVAMLLLNTLVAAEAQAGPG